MLIDDVIRQAESEQEIHLLLTAYLEGIQFGDRKYFISDAVVTLPLKGANDLNARFKQLLVDLDDASRALDDRACLAQKEALHVFGAALHRWIRLKTAKYDAKHRDRMDRPMPMTAVRQCGLL